MAPFIDYTARTSSARSQRLGSPPASPRSTLSGDAARGADEVGQRSPLLVADTACGAEGANDVQEDVHAASAHGAAPAGEDARRTLGGDLSRAAGAAAEEGEGAGEAREAAGEEPSVLFRPAAGVRKSAFFREDVPSPSSPSSPTSPSQSYHGHGRGAFSPPPGPRKLRRKSHGAAASPPASPVVSYILASGHPVAEKPLRRRDPLPGQVPGAPAPQPPRRSEDAARPAAGRNSPPVAHAAGVALHAPTFGPFVREAAAEHEEQLSATDRHYVSRMLANLQLQYEFSALSQIGTLAGYGPPFLPHANGPNSRPPPSSSKPTSTSSGGGSRFFGLLGPSAPKPPSRDPQFAGYTWSSASLAPSPLCSYLFARFVHAMPGLRGAKSEYWTEHVQPFFDTFAERDLSSTIERGEITKRRMLALGIVRLLGTYTSSALPRVPGPSAPARPSGGMMRLVDVLVAGGGGMDGLARAVLGGPEGEGAYNAWVGVLDAGEGAFHVLTQPLASSHPLAHALRPLSSFTALSSSLSSLDPAGRLALPSLPVGHGGKKLDARDAQTWLRWVVVALSSPAGTVRSPGRDDALLSSARAQLEAFLLGGGAQSSLPAPEAARLRREVEDADAAGETLAEEWKAVGRRAKALRTTWVHYRGALIRGDELDETMKHVRRCKTLKDLPKEYRDAEEWAMIYVAQALHYIFVGAATGPEVLNILRSFHELIPYGAIKLGLNLVNPTLAIRAIVQLLLGQPVGQLSLFQRIWSHVCHAANKHQRALIAQFRAKLSAHSGLCDALQAHVAEGYVKRQATKASALDREEDIVLTIVRERCTHAECALVEKWHAAFVDAGEGPSAGGEAGSFADLKELLAAYYRFRDREQVLAIALEPNTPKLLHASIAVFYGTIHAVANASKLSERVADLQAFLDDLVAVAGRAAEPHEFIRLAQRHHQALYYFVHELATAPGLLDPILAWAADGLAFLHEGARTPSGQRAGPDVDALLARAGPDNERRDVLREAREFARWTALRKVQHDVALRVDLLLSARAGAPAGGAERAQLSKDALWARYLAFLPLSTASRTAFATAAERQKREAHRAGPGGDLEWAAWWAARETAGAAGREGVVVAQREAARAGLSPVASPAPVQGKTLRRESSGASSLGAGKKDKNGKKAAAVLPPVEERAHEAHVEQELAIPPPASEATRALLSGYVAQLKSALGRRGGE
ncbi:hypothetical protein JCM10450v2_007558 [Rhodotorula kratochvilovae]